MLMKMFVVLLILQSSVVYATPVFHFDTEIHYTSEPLNNQKVSRTTAKGKRLTTNIDAIYSPLTVFQCMTKDDEILRLQIQGYGKYNSKTGNTTNEVYFMNYLRGDSTNELNSIVSQETKNIQYVYYTIENDKVYSKDFIMNDDSRYYFFQLYLLPEKHNIGDGRVVVVDKNNPRVISEHNCLATSNKDIKGVTASQFDFLPINDDVLNYIIQSMVNHPEQK